jgi:aminopeptidase
MSDEEKRQAGLNVSLQHVDFTVGSDKLAITGVKTDGTRTAVMENGLWSAIVRDVAER